MLGDRATEEVDAALSMYMVAPVVSAVAALGLLTILTRRRNLPIDRPNERSLHATPVPRVGGLAIVPAIAVSWALVPGAVPWAVWGPALFLFALSFLDDAIDLPVMIRLLAHLLAAAVVAGFLVWPQAGFAAAFIAVLAISWMTNLYNFMDGSDGLAGGMTLIGFTAYAIAAWIGGAPAFAFACLAVACASLAFLCRNFHPARVFLGDAGSIPLGFLAASLGTVGWLDGLWPAWFPILVFSPFIVDATVTLIRRASRREKVWRAHRDHYYQRLVRLGWGHRRTAVAEYLLMTACAVAALMGLDRSVAAQIVLLAACAVAQFLLMLLIDRAWHRHEEEA